MRKSERAEIIRKELKKLYPSPPIPLDHTNAYTLLVAVVLSAQSTDKKVNELTKNSVYYTHLTLPTKRSV